MEIINIDKLQGHKRIVLTGRYEHVRPVTIQLYNGHGTFDAAPIVYDYFQDYPEIIDKMFNNIFHDHCHIIYTNNLEFLDVMLKSKHDFILGTVREDPNGQLRIRVKTKEEALYMRQAYDAELRI
jgi:hypothetical protein